MTAAKTKSGRTRSPARSSRVVAMLLGISFVVSFAILFTLLALQVRIGQGYFAYLWSPVRALRTPRAFVGIGIGVIACGAVWLLARQLRRATGLALLALAFALWGAWTWWAPPNTMTQQMFSMTSPSSDGAFVLEANGIRSLPVYLRDFNQRLQTPVERMGGTRVLSNPPGMTIFVRGVSALLPGQTAMERYLVEEGHIEPAGVGALALSLRAGLALCAAWALAGAFAYGLGRLFLSPSGSAVFAIIVTFNPCAVEFVPGKDPAQLVTVCAMLWAWLAGWKRQSPLLAALAGAILVVGSTIGLIHIWVALAAYVATTWNDRKLDIRRTLAATAGASGVCLLAFFLVGWNIPSTLLAVARRWGEIQKTFTMNRGVWYAIGLPIFLLFISPAIWMLVGLSLRRRRMNFGTRLALCTAGVMLVIYLGFGMTYELPRLWVAFLPALLLGLCVDRPLLRGSRLIARPRVAAASALIVAAQVAFTAMHWTLFDVREVENRLISERFYH